MSQTAWTGGRAISDRTAAPVLAHLGDLHLGYRAYRRVEQGWNARERDVAQAFQRAVQELIRVEPALILLAGDIFDYPSPPPSALVTLVRGVETLRAGLPGVRVLAIAGRRDTPLSPSDPGPVAALDSLAGVEAAAGTARSVYVEELDLHALLVPYRAVVEEPFPELRPDPGARWNVLVVRGGPGESGPPVDPSEWDYVALAGGHSHRELGVGVHQAGSLERVGPGPWEEAAEEKGFATWDLEARASRFHLVRGRPVVELAPTPVDPEDPGSINERIREVLEEIPGGVDDKVMRLVIEGLAPQEQGLLDSGYLARIRRKALHLHVEIRPRSGRASTPGSRDAEWALERVKAELQRSDDDAYDPDDDRPLRLAEDLLPGEERGEMSASPSEEEGVLPVEGVDRALGRIALDLPVGLVALLCEDHRAREALVELLARRMDFPSPGSEKLARFLRPGSKLRELTVLLDAATRMAASSPAVDALEDALESLGEQARGEGEGRTRVSTSRIRELEKLPEELESLEGELKELRATAAEVGGDLEFRTMEWLRERQDAETQLQAYRDRARELKARFREIESAGDDAPCPTCGRPLGDHQDGVVAELREEWEAVVQDGQWWRRRREQLEPKPEHLQELESRSVRLHAAIGDLAERLERRRAELGSVAEPQKPEADRAGADDEGFSEEEDSTGAGALVRALRQVRREILDEARERVLIRASSLVGRISGGLYTGLLDADGVLALLQDGAPTGIRSEADRALVRLALRTSAAVEAVEQGGGVPLFVVGPDLDQLQEEEWVAAIWAMRSLSDRIGRIVVVSRRGLVERVAEAFHQALEVWPADTSEAGSSVREVTIASGTVRISL